MWDKHGVTRTGRVALCGQPNVGKSSLLNALIGQPLALVSAKPQATRLPVVGLRTEGRSQMVFVDLPGLLDPAYPMQERMAALARQELADADLILHLHPAPEAPSIPLKDAARLSQPPRAPVLLVYSKADLVSPGRRAELEQEGLVVSARTGEGVAALVQAIETRLPVGPFLFPADDLGTQPLRFFVAEYLREAALEHLDDEVPYAVAAEVEEFQEERDPMYIRATLFVERDSQKGIVIGSGGRTIRRIGEHARRRLEEITGRRAFLETRVKVLPRWRKRPQDLVRFGFPDVNPGGTP